MTKCTVQDDGTIELYFYSELEPDEQAGVAEHLRHCRECAAALEELTVIRDALAARPDVSAPPSGDWSAFMDRLDAAVVPTAATAGTAPTVLQFKSPAVPADRSWLGLLTTAALLAIVAISVFFASSAGRRTIQPRSDATNPEIAAIEPGQATPIRDGLESVGARHFERSKLVVLGLATKETSGARTADWAYERELATSLLNDTRLYRMAAEERGLTSLAGVMRDLELVLLQTSMAQATDSTALPQIQRLIQKRGLVQKMDVAGTIGLVP
jgi:hypothetical protein